MVRGCTLANEWTPEPKAEIIKTPEQNFRGLFLLMGLTSAAVVTLLVVLQLALSTAGQAYQYSIGWTNGRKRAYEADQELQRLPLTFSVTRDKELEDEFMEQVSQDSKFRKRLIRVLWKMDQQDKNT